MRPTILTLAAAATTLFAPPAPACTFCGGGFGSRQTLRENYHTAKAVVHGRLKNARVDPSGVGGTTEFHVVAVLKSDAPLTPGQVLVLPQYFPLVGDTPTDYVLFGSVADGKFDTTHGAPGTAAVVEYVRGAAKLPADDPARRLAFCFTHLDADPATSGDAFLEFAKATDADILKAKPALDPAKLRKWLTDPNTPADRLGVFALMLGVAGGPADAKVFADLVSGPFPLPERAATNLGGLLAGYALLDPKVGWAVTEAALTDAKRPFTERLAAVSAVRFFQATRPEAKADVLRCYRAVIRQGELADLAIDDLRRWGWWDLTADVLVKYDAVPSPPAIVRRGVVRYALSCPGDDAKRLVATARQREPKLVETVEESLRQFEKK